MSPRLSTTPEVELRFPQEFHGQNILQLAALVLEIMRYNGLNLGPPQRGRIARGLPSRPETTKALRL